MTKQALQDRDSFNAGLLKFLDASPTPFHAVENMAAALEAAGFTCLDESDAWRLKTGGRYYCSRNGSSIIAFVYAGEFQLESGIRIVGAHTDSPCLKLKPVPEVHSTGCLQLGIEVYGGALLNPWFDRDLSLAGRLNLLHDDGKCNGQLINVQRPVGLIPSLAIHLDRTANKERSVNPQTDMPVVVVLDKDESASLSALLAECADIDAADAGRISDFELSFYDTQPAAITGWRKEFISSARLDNLLSCYTGLQALLAADGAYTSMLVCNDHEEVGSQSAIGAQGPMLESILQRLCKDGETMSRTLRRSMLISADNAHAIHPSYPDRHDSGHGPQLNAGPVIKYNAQQRYASTGQTAAIFKSICAAEDVPVQSFVARADMGCGSTIGPLTASAIGVAALDVGVPQWGMHSIRETAGTEDAFSLGCALRRFYQTADVASA